MAPVEEEEESIEMLAVNWMMDDFGCCSSDGMMAADLFGEDVFESLDWTRRTIYKEMGEEMLRRK
jgi:hypothetical protein